MPMRILLAITFLLLAQPAFAHVGVGHTDSFSAGVGHPLGGLDHILVMVTVGLWGVLAGGRAIWTWPAAFVVTMLVGFAAAAGGLHVPFVEPVILASIIVLGLLVAMAVKAPVWLGAVIVGVFAFFHGHAHGTEAGGVSLIPYAAGFALATATLHIIGIGMGLLAEGRIGQMALRALGAVAVLGGLAIAAEIL